MALYLDLGIEILPVDEPAAILLAGASARNGFG